MKKMYISPMIEIESYDLSSSIAASCLTTVQLGPGIPGEIDACAGFITPVFPDFPDQNSIQSQSFYNGENGFICDCYYTAGGEGYFSS